MRLAMAMAALACACGLERVPWGRRRARSVCARLRGGGARDDGGYYAALGVSKDATSAEIARAYRRKSLACHPDKGGDAEAFKKLNDAKDVLGNEEKRRAYDRFGLAGVDPQFGGGGAGQHGGMGGQGGVDARTAQMFEQMFGSFGSAFGDAFGGGVFGGGGFSRGPRQRRFAITVSLDDCYTGRTLSVALDDGSRCRVRLEPGVGDGDVVKASGLKDGSSAIFELREAAHATYKRRGADLLVDATIPLVLGRGRERFNVTST